MDLSTHFMFGLALACVFFHRPEAILLVGLGSLIPDLDREYWFMRPKKYLTEEQLHRALFHNFIIIAVTYFISPYISLGVFLHCLLDSFTTVKDRGVEWFYPFTRLVKRGLFDCEGNPPDKRDEPLKPLPRDRVIFYNEDPKELIKEKEFAEPKPVPWRRTYGPALNSQILDRTIFFSSIIIFIVWLAHNYLSYGFTTNLFSRCHWIPYVFGYLSVGLLFLSGEFTREDGILKNHLTESKKLLCPTLIVGMILGGLSLGFAWVYWHLGYSHTFIYPLLKNWLYILLSILSIIISFIGVWKYNIRPEKLREKRAIV